MVQETQKLLSIFKEERQKLKELYKEKQTKLSALFEEVGLFFAFSVEQFNEQKKEDEIYVRIYNGGFIPKKNVIEFETKFLETLNEYSNTVLNLISPKTIILDTLLNYEAFYSGELCDAIESLKEYEFTTEQIVEVYREYNHLFKD